MAMWPGVVPPFITLYGQAWLFHPSLDSKRYSVLLGGVTQMGESTWLDDAQRGEAGQFAVWLCVEEVIW
jgi:hypothetical protein